jgi:hypothetical protein
MADVHISIVWSGKCGNPCFLGDKESTLKASSSRLHNQNRLFEQGGLREYTYLIKSALQLVNRDRTMSRWTMICEKHKLHSVDGRRILRMNIHSQLSSISVFQRIKIVKNK